MPARIVVNGRIRAADDKKNKKKSRRHMSKGEPPEFRLTRHDANVETNYTTAAATCVPQSVRFGSLAMIWM